MGPQISVCIPTYNQARYLAAAIESVLGQSLTDLEILIIDDGSQDGTREIAEMFARKDPRIVFRVNPVNLGMVENWNLCLREARGEYVKFLFGDDLLSSPDALRRMAAVLDADPRISLVAAARNVIDEDSRHLAVWSHFADRTVIEGTVVIRQCLVAPENLIGEPSVVLFRKSQAGRGFDPRYRQIVDLEMWFHLLEQGKFAFIGDPLCAFRVHPEQQTRVNIAHFRHHEDILRLFAEYLNNPAKGYIEIGRIKRAYLTYDRRYNVWKEYRKGQMDRKSVLHLIGSDGTLFRFFLAYPFYKVFKPLRKIWQRRSRLRS